VPHVWELYVLFLWPLLICLLAYWLCVSSKSNELLWIPVGIVCTIIVAVADSSLLPFPWELYTLLLWPFLFVPSQSHSRGNCMRYRCGHSRNPVSSLPYFPLAVSSPLFLPCLAARCHPTELFPHCHSTLSMEAMELCMCRS
jgi:hypothetical protein